MAKNSGSSRTIEGVQGVVLLAAIPTGLIPLVTFIASGEHGRVFRWFFGERTGTMGYLLPALVLAVAIVVIGVLEVVKKQRG
jgi:uncharacterized membrane protein